MAVLALDYQLPSADLLAILAEHKSRIIIQCTQRADMTNEKEHVVALHPNAWQGLKIIIYGQSSTVPMQIEQTISEIAPFQETRIDSFENYDDALDHCKATKDVGLGIVLEDCGDHKASNVFKSLAAPFESRGLPFLGVILHNGSKTLEGLQGTNNNQNILAYWPAAQFLQKDPATQRFEELWRLYTKKMESFLIPEAVQDSLRHLANETSGADSTQFCERTIILMSSRLNISWKEEISAQWTVIKNLTDEAELKFLDAHPITKSLLHSHYTAPAQKKDLVSLLSERGNLLERIIAVTLQLEKLHKSGELPKILQTIKTTVRPGAPAMLRHMAQSVDRILQISAESIKFQSNEKKAV